MDNVWHFGCNHDHSAMFAARAGLTDEERRQENEIIRGKFRKAVALSGFFLIVEVVGWYLSKSLAIWSDASHLLSDVITLLISWGASYLAERPRDLQHSTFGWRRIESLAALLSMLTLLVLTVYLMAVALVRFVLGFYPDTAVVGVDGRLMSGVSLTGVFVNLALVAILGEHHHIGLVSAPPPPTPKKPSDVTAWSSSNPNSGSLDLEVSTEKTSASSDERSFDGEEANAEEMEMQALMITSSCEDDDDNEGDTIDKERRNSSILPMSNVNLRATYLHVLGDLLQSIGILIASLVIWAWPKTAHWVDPLCTSFFCAWVITMTMPVIRASLAILLLQVPPSVDATLITQELEDMPTVTRVEQLRLFSISQEEVALTAHIFTKTTKQEQDDDECRDDVLRQAKQIIGGYPISESTIQVEEEEEEKPSPSFSPFSFAFGLDGETESCRVCPA